MLSGFAKLIQLRVEPGKRIAQIRPDPPNTILLVPGGKKHLPLHALQQGRLRLPNLRKGGHQVLIRLIQGSLRGILLGIQPDTGTWHEGWWFDMTDGVFRPGPSGGGHWLRPDEARVIWLLSRMTFANMHLFRFDRTQRNRVLDVMLAYYRLHNSTLGTLRSPEVLKQLFI